MVRSEAGKGGSVIRSWEGMGGEGERGGLEGGVVKGCVRKGVGGAEDMERGRDGFLV